MEKESLEQYAHLLGDIKNRIRQGQAKAVLAVNAELLAMYWDIGKIIHERQRTTAADEESKRASGF